MFDGDSAAIYRVSDEQSINEIYNNAFLKNLIMYEHNGSFIHTIINEADYAYNVLKNTEFNNDDNIIIINSLSEIEYDEKIDINKKYKFKDKFYTYGLLLINAWCEFEEVLVTKSTSTQELSNLIYQNVSGNSTKYHYILNELNRKLNWFLTISNTEALTIPFGDACELLNSSKNDELIHNLPKNPYVGFQIYEAISDKFYNNINKDTQLYKLTKSKFRKTQFSKSLLNIGYLADANGHVISNPINGCVLGGLTEDLFFQTSSGTRKALVDKIRSVPASGYAQRTLVVNLSPLEIVEEDCGSKFTFDVEVKNSKHAESLIHRYYLDENNNVKEITKPDINNIIGKTIRLRSPITCATENYKICRTCVGNYNFTSPYIGILAGQYLEERLTQSTMSSHHLSGAANLVIDSKFKDYVGNHLICIVNNEDSTFNLEFDEAVPQDIIDLITGHSEYRFLNIKETNILQFSIYNDDEFIDNEDASKIVDNVSLLLRSCVSTKRNKIPELVDTYYGLITEFFKISNIYTIFIEILLANSHVNKDNIVYRYCLRDNLNTTISKRYSIKSLNRLISKILSWLYEPNKSSIRNFYNYSNDYSNDTEVKKLSIFEKIWIDKF